MIKIKNIFNISNELKDLKENENILKILDIFLMNLIINNNENNRDLSKNSIWMYMINYKKELINMKHKVK